VLLMGVSRQWVSILDSLLSSYRLGENILSVRVRMTLGVIESRMFFSMEKDVLLRLCERNP